MISLVSFVLQIIVGRVSHAFFHTHYNNGIWIIHIYFAWLAIDRIILMKWGKTARFYINVNKIP